MNNNSPSLLAGSIWKGLWSLGVPAFSSLMLQTFVILLTDKLCIGRLEDAELALAAISPSEFVIWTVYALVLMISTGVTSLVARSVGAGDKRTAGHVAGQGIWLGLIASIVIGGGGLLSVSHLFTFMGTTADVTGYGISYLKIMFWGMWSLILFFVLDAIYRGNGGRSVE